MTKAKLADAPIDLDIVESWYPIAPHELWRTFPHRGRGETNDHHINTLFYDQVEILRNQRQHQSLIHGPPKLHNKSQGMGQNTTGIVQSRYCRPRTVGVVQEKTSDGKDGWIRRQRWSPRKNKTRQRKQPHSTKRFFREKSPDGTSVSDQDRVVQTYTWWGSITSGFENSRSKKLRPARAAEPSIKDAAIRGNWIGNDLRQRNGQPSIEEKLYVNRQHVHALNKYSQQKKKIMPSVDISTTTINKQRIALSGRFCWRNQKKKKPSTNPWWPHPWKPLEKPTIF